MVVGLLGCWVVGLLGCWVVGCCVVVVLRVVGWLLVVGCWLLVVGCWLLVVGCWLLVVVLLCCCVVVLLLCCCCVACCCCAVVCCCVCGGVCVWCAVCAVRNAEKTWKKPCGGPNTPSCVESKRPRVYRHHVHMSQSMWTCCWYTRGRFESTHGDVLELHKGGVRARGRRRGEKVGSKDRSKKNIGKTKI